MAEKTIYTKDVNGETALDYMGETLLQNQGDIKLSREPTVSSRAGAANRMRRKYASMRETSQKKDVQAERDYGEMGTSEDEPHETKALPLSAGIGSLHAFPCTHRKIPPTVPAPRIFFQLVDLYYGTTSSRLPTAL